MPKHKFEIIDQFDEAMSFRAITVDRKPGKPGPWYVGVTSDPENRLFTQHKVDESEDIDWSFAEAISSKVAREVEAYYLGKGLEGGTGGGSDASNFVYIYRVTSSTVQ